uniref:Uncharacterized protein n=1 Tax=Anguilla anguilla TaxID=7936 RepID=A0A0E9QY78_ANGAN
MKSRRARRASLWPAFLVLG